MKSWIFTALMVVIVVSCSKTSVNRPGVKEENANGGILLQELLSKDIASQRVMFGMLTVDDRKAIWQEHLIEYATRNQLTDEQIAIVNELTQQNKAGYYQTGTDDHAIATTHFFQQWMEKAKKVFNEKEIYELAFSLNSMSQEIEFNKASFRDVRVGDEIDPVLGQLLKDPERSTTNNESLPDCGCRVGSSFTCPYTIVNPNPIGLPIVAFGTCSFNGGSPCDVEGGCGFMGWSLCDGNVCVSSFS